MTERLTNYTFGQVTVDGRVHTQDLVVCGEQVYANWRREQGHSLVPIDIEPYLSPDTSLLIVGCGAMGRLVVPETTVEWVVSRGITLKSLHSGEACDYFNRLSPSVEAVLGLHLTC